MKEILNTRAWRLRVMLHRAEPSKEETRACWRRHIKKIIYLRTVFSIEVMEGTQYPVLSITLFSWCFAAWWVSEKTKEKMP